MGWILDSSPLPSKLQASALLVNKNYKQEMISMTYSTSSHEIQTLRDADCSVPRSLSC